MVSGIGWGWATDMYKRMVSVKGKALLVTRYFVCYSPLIMRVLLSQTEIFHN